jgi:threonine dehydrogenase-like Zn-dependent dehydrogenase
MWPECISLHRRGLVRTDRIVTHRLSLADFAEAIEISRTRRNGAIKVLLTP